MNEARKRMALFPKGSKTYYVSEELWVPVVIMGNVHIYPGVPGLFERMLEGSSSLFTGGLPFVQWEVFTRVLEGDFAADLTRIASEWPDAKIGSYPQNDTDGKPCTRLFIETRNEDMGQDLAKLLGDLTQAYRVAQRPVEAPVAKL